MNGGHPGEGRCTGRTREEWGSEKGGECGYRKRGKRLPPTSSLGSQFPWKPQTFRWQERKMSVAGSFWPGLHRPHTDLDLISPATPALKPSQADTHPHLPSASLPSHTLRLRSQADSSQGCLVGIYPISLASTRDPLCPPLHPEMALPVSKRLLGRKTKGVSVCWKLRPN